MFSRLRVLLYVISITAGGFVVKSVKGKSKATSKATAANAGSSGSVRQVRKRAAALKHSLIGESGILLDDAVDDDDEDVRSCLRRRSKPTSQPGNN